MCVRERERRIKTLSLNSKRICRNTSKLASYLQRLLYLWRLGYFFLFCNIKIIRKIKNSHTSFTSLWCPEVFLILIWKVFPEKRHLMRIFLKKRCLQIKNIPFERLSPHTHTDTHILMGFCWKERIESAGLTQYRCLWWLWSLQDELMWQA